MTPRDRPDHADNSLMRRRMNSRIRAACEHSETVSTMFAGIERTVCVECGHVSFGHHHDLVSEGGTRLDVPHVPVSQA